MSKSLEELKNELCKIKKISDSRDFKNGWDEAIKAVSEREKKLVEALIEISKLNITGSNVYGSAEHAVETANKALKDYLGMK